MSEAEAANPWEISVGLGYRRRYVGDGLPIVPHATKLPATKPEDGYFKVQREPISGGVLLMINQQDHVPGKRRATSAQVTLSKAHASVLRDWLNAVLADDERNP